MNTPDAIEAAVLAGSDITPEQLRDGSCKLSHVVEARRVLAYLLREDAGLGYRQINAHFGIEGHYAALHRCQQAELRIATDNRFKTRVNVTRMRLEQAAEEATDAQQ